MRLSEVLKNTDIECYSEIEIKGISLNSKDIKSDYIFFAIKGRESDGNLFIDEAIRNGAKVIITEEEINRKDAIVLRTKDILKTLSVSSKNFYSNPSEKLNLIGITGTKGKTTTSFIIEKILNYNGIKTGVIGTINYRSSKRIISEAENTTPLACKLNMLLDEIIKDGDEAAVMEVSSHSLKLKRVEDIQFNSAIFTNLQSDHMDFHKTMEDYSRSKLILFELLNKSDKKNKTAILNEDDPFSTEIKKVLSKEIKILTYSIEKNSDIKAKNIELNPWGSTFDIEHEGEKYEFKTELIGKHNIYNILAALAVGICRKIDFQKLSEAILEIKTVPGRVEKIESEEGFFAYIDYAHTEKSLIEVLKTLNSIPHSKIITVFGCGGDRDRTKRPLMGKAASSLSDFVVITNDNPRTEDPLEIIREIEKGIKDLGKTNYSVIPDRKEAINYAVNMARKNDIILIAGKGHENYQIIGKEKFVFSDKETLIEAINLKKKKEKK
ncbi:MAG TPA: UDP-N-acetylmuramoyl-L-alanyl-D-glutamate--2,6-diaminopimelate ligase [Elusimicrobiales bacterium]|nr:UDP-N-acetylmuramoyl-L-alanyl-D-glutamate--2,6-diaminopimelate ligase [Elusimicrobiales bacterium]HPO95467.1 UDP-N-acetylmuramoyl-L-alanyl-D-glutamate--2,6-diaminopimelate ligase [Elusimicrobiales bacterium]